MNKKLTALVIGAGVAALALTGCSTTPDTKPVNTATHSTTPDTKPTDDSITGAPTTAPGVVTANFAANTTTVDVQGVTIDCGLNNGSYPVSVTVRFNADGTLGDKSCEWNVSDKDASELDQIVQGNG